MNNYDIFNKMTKEHIIDWLKKNYLINNKSLEYSDYRRGELVRPRILIYQDVGKFVETFNKSL